VSNVYRVNFRLFDKVDVIGETASPLWTFLTGRCLYYNVVLYLYA